MEPERATTAGRRRGAHRAEAVFRRQMRTPTPSGSCGPSSTSASTGWCPSASATFDALSRNSSITPLRAESPRTRQSAYRWERAEATRGRDPSVAAAGWLANRELRVLWRREIRRAPPLRGAGAIGAQSMGAGRRMDDGQSGQHAERSARADRVPLSCARSAPGPGTATGRDAGAGRVSIDGRPPGPAHGVDVDEGGNGTVAEQRLYQPIRQPAPIVDRRFEIEFLDAGLEAFAFTFGGSSRPSLTLRRV